MSSSPQPLRADLHQKIGFTRHGALRRQQRSIPNAVIEGLIDFGEERHDRRGCISYSFSKRSWRCYARHLGDNVKKYERYRSVYVVVAENGAVITTAWRH